jgi:thymidylate synthase (FAD)
MDVKLLVYTPIGDRIASSAAKSTRKNDFVLEEKGDEKFIINLINIGHKGILEHTYFTFHVSKISRVLTHQLVRHRIASYLQQSGRHVTPKKTDYVIPPSINTVHELQHYKEYMEFQWDNFQSLKKMGVPLEDARYILPDGYYTHIVITMNARQLRHFFKLRCSEEAQWEIREMATIMLKKCHEIYPVFFHDLYIKFIKNEGTIS